jgi:hypothetical protein
MATTRTRRVRVEDADLRLAVASILAVRGHVVAEGAVRFEIFHCEPSPLHPDGYVVTGFIEVQEPDYTGADWGEVTA